MCFWGECEEGEEKSGWEREGAVVVVKPIYGNENEMKF